MLGTIISLIITTQNACVSFYFAKIGPIRAQFHDVSFGRMRDISFLLFDRLARI